MTTKHAREKLQRWQLQLQELDISIQYRKGIENQNADALSRAFPLVLVATTIDPPAPPNIALLQDQDPILGPINKNLRDGCPATGQRLGMHLIGLFLSEDGFLMREPPASTRFSPKFQVQLVLWKGANGFPFLKALALDTLMIPTISARSERVFSMVVQLSSEKFNRIADENLEKRVLMKGNKHLQK